MPSLMPHVPSLMAHASRRAVLSTLGSASLGALLTACGSSQAAETTMAEPGAATPEPPAAPRSAAAPSAASAPLRPHVLSAAERLAIEERFRGRKPTQWGLAVTGVVTRTATTAVALTFDACGGPGGSRYDSALIQTLRRLKVPATLFLNARWIEANPSLSAELAADPLFEIGNHGTAHVPLSVSGRSAYGIPGTASLAAALDELLGNEQRVSALAGAAVPWFRPGTAFYDDVTAAATSAAGLVPLNFSVNADAGATFPGWKVAAQLRTVERGDIVISHMNQPGSGTAAGYAAGLPALLGRGIRFTTLSQSGLAVPGHTA
ncbi:polysaccharide deacetylase family protein [Sinomonas terrae]|uniref:Polysaccharide deacetylase family protein n=1 Tax=Sinomonas terrae TaxID=2908838 RepID=A0ABS9U1F8_9MICC|nr:polysaccharide deacetylase family protein [Sinomonas terrae]MCH6470509.1 polysaccharide deacetylase family protein [Sinomonas terrae]